MQSIEGTRLCKCTFVLFRCAVPFLTSIDFPGLPTVDTLCKNYKVIATILVRRLTD